MATKVGICNMALAHLGHGQYVTDIDTEQSAEAKVSRIFYDSALEAILRDYTWPFATRFMALALIEEDPTDEWGYSYRYPNDCLFVRRIFSGQRNDNSDSRVRYIVSSDEAGVMIYADSVEAEIEFTSKMTNPGLFPADFSLALSYRLAAYIAPTLARDSNLAKECYALYQYHSGRALANGKNEEQKDRQTESDLILARE